MQDHDKPEVLRRQIVPVPSMRPASPTRRRVPWLFVQTSQLAAAGLRLATARGDVHRATAMRALMREFCRLNGCSAPTMHSGDIVIVDDEDGDEMRIRVGDDIGLRTTAQLGTAMLSSGGVVAAYYGPGHPLNTPLAYAAYAAELRLPTRERLVPITQDVEQDKGRGLMPLAARTNRPPFAG